jgi:hypothetical protein
MVAATGPIFTREPINLGIRKFAEIRWSEIVVKGIIINYYEWACTVKLEGSRH